MEEVSRPLLVFETDGVLVDAAGAWVAAPGTLEALAERLYAQSSSELRRRGALTEALDEQGRLVALLAVATSLAMAVAIAAFASWRIAGPLRELRVAARAIEPGA